MNPAEYVHLIGNKRAATHGHTRNGGWRSPTYHSWKSMRRRCSDPDDKDYGGRGIGVCKRWDKFEKFLSDMGERPAGKTLDRINSNKNYSPSNCKWSTASEQQNNKTNCFYITYKGQTLTISQWSQKTGLSRMCIQHRIKIGWHIDKVIETPSRRP